MAPRLRELAAEPLRLRKHGLVPKAKLVPRAKAPKAEAEIAQQRQLTTSKAKLTCCLDCVNRGCDKNMDGEVNWTRSASRCDCQAHHTAQ